MRVVLAPSLPRIPRRYLVSAAVHGLLVAAWAWSPERTRNFEPLGGAMAVELVGAPPSGGGAVAAPAEATPPPVEPPPEPEGPSLQPEPEPEPEPEKPKEPKPKAPKKEDAEARSSPAPGPTGPPGPPGPQTPGTAGPGPGGPGTTLSLGGGLPGSDFYGATVRAAIEARWRRPVLDSDVPAEVAIGFEILRDGTVRDVEVVRPSGIPSLDRSALRAVIEASPLPPFPAALRVPSTNATMIFILHPE